MSLAISDARQQLRDASFSLSTAHNDALSWVPPTYLNGVKRERTGVLNATRIEEVRDLVDQALEILGA